MPQQDSNTWAAIITAYAQNGRLDQAHEIFQTLALQDRQEQGQEPQEHRNLAAWNAIIAAHAQFGNGADAVALLHAMLLEGSSSPSDGSFLGALNGCAHAGLVEESRSIFQAMASDYSIAPRLEHYCCVMEALGRVGQLDRAEELMAAMPYLPDEVAWVGFVGIFQIHGQVTRAAAAAQQFVDANPASATAQVLRSVVLRWAASGAQNREI
ncbi:hypothetical protein SELMODRAFT_88015 [Selaginella moellendorffii]|uniref:Pentacotripeptide-repeat region of PRORP domain-containing protein n=2 Tax=Selaginella moellendorffii TaxID=88036 RepID=D8R9J5_SELML|nr:hypothetical protein SELMODRAFT_88015 [Selaginella moellendorffii]